MIFARAEIMWMFRRFPLLALSFAFLLCAASAQQTVTLGTATVALNGPWKFHTGDNMAWAQPDYEIPPGTRWT
jgi:hypothetical protein